MERHRRPTAIREALEARWPDTRWSVRLARTVEAVTVIRWTDGPDEDAVRSVAYDHEGRLYVRLERATALLEPHAGEIRAPLAAPAAVAASREGAPHACPIPYDDTVCAACGGRLEADGTRHATTGSAICPCARCGRSRPDARERGDAVVCGECEPATVPA